MRIELRKIVRKPLKHFLCGGDGSGQGFTVGHHRRRRVFRVFQGGENLNGTSPKLYSIVVPESIESAGKIPPAPHSMFSNATPFGSSVFPSDG